MWVNAYYLWKWLTTLSSELHPEYVYFVQCQWLCNQGKWHCQAYLQSTLAALLLFLTLWALSLSNPLLHIYLLMCEDKMRKGKPKLKKYVCVASDVWWMWYLEDKENDLATANGHESWRNKGKKSYKMSLWIINWILLLFSTNYKWRIEFGGAAG